MLARLLVSLFFFLTFTPLTAGCIHVPVRSTGLSAAGPDVSTLNAAARTSDDTASGAPRGSFPLLEAIRTARTEREAALRAGQFGNWVLENPDERAGLENHGLVVRALRANEWLVEPDRVVARLYELSDVWPATCSSTDHALFKSRIHDMKVMAETANRPAVVAALDERLNYVLGYRTRLDAQGVCLQ